MEYTIEKNKVQLNTVAIRFGSMIVPVNVDMTGRRFLRVSDIRAVSRRPKVRQNFEISGDRFANIRVCFHLRDAC